MEKTKPGCLTFGVALILRPRKNTALTVWAINESVLARRDSAYSTLTGEPSSYAAQLTVTEKFDTVPVARLRVVVGIVIT